MTKSSSLSIKAIMFTLSIFQDVMVMIDVFQVCMIKVGSSIGDWDNANMNLIS